MTQQTKTPENVSSDELTNVDFSGALGLINSQLEDWSRDSGADIQIDEHDDRNAIEAIKLALKIADAVMGETTGYMDDEGVLILENLGFEGLDRQVSENVFNAMRDELLRGIE